ncbi:MAG: YlxR family protein [Chloroflexi bacterium]|nr:YlxR family protein [Chloroflexota bacterium]
MPVARREPQRTCIACREVAGKRSLVRLVRSPEGAVAVESPGERLAGRGAYLCHRRSCWERALGGATIGNALRASPNSGDLEGLRRYFENIPNTGAEEA